MGRSNVAWAQRITCRDNPTDRRFVLAFRAWGDHFWGTTSRGWGHMRAVHMEAIYRAGVLPRQLHPAQRSG